MTKGERKRGGVGWLVLGVLLALGAALALSQPAPAVPTSSELMTRAGHYAEAVAGDIPPKISDKQGSLQGNSVVSDAIRHQILGQEGVQVVRVWSSDAVLLYSSSEGDTMGGAGVRPLVHSGVAGQPSAVPGGTDPLRVIVPVGAPVRAAIEIDQTPTASGLPWGALGMVFAAGAVIVALFGVVLLTTSGRRRRSAAAGPKPAKGTGLAATWEPDPRAPTKELERVEAKLRQAEQSKAAMTLQLEQLRQQLISGEAGLVGRIGELEAQLSGAQLRAHDAKQREDQAQVSAREAETRTAAAEEKAELADDAVAKARVAELEAAHAAEQQRAGSLERKVAELEARLRDAELLSVASQAPTIRTRLGRTTADEMSSVVTSADVPAEEAEAEAPAEPLATDPAAWNAVADALRRNALGDEASQGESPASAPTQPAALPTAEAQSELRARLARKAASKKMTKPDAP